MRMEMEKNKKPAGRKPAVDVHAAEKATKCSSSIVRGSACGLELPQWLVPISAEAAGPSLWLDSQDNMQRGVKKFFIMGIYN